MNRREWDWNEEMGRACIACGRANRFHMVFWDPVMGYYVRQGSLPDARLVSSSDHYALVDNLQYLEWKSEQTEK
jgi:hypothetical protein